MIQFSVATLQRGDKFIEVYRNTHRAVAYDEVKRKIPEYIDLFNQLVNAYTKQGDLPILIMIEDIEKSADTDKLQELFFNHSIYFRQFKVDILLTAPGKL